MKHFLFIISILILNTSLYSQPDVKSLVNMGTQLISLNNYEEALEKFNEALDYLPSYAPALDGKASLLILMEDYKGAGKIIENAIEKNSDYPQFYLTRGKVLIHKGKFKDAIEDLNRALDLAQGISDKAFENKIYVNRGAAYQKLMAYDEALNDYSKAIQLDDSNPNVFIYRGYLYYQTMEYEEALKDFNTVIEIDPENPFAYYNRGMIYIKQVKDDEACEDFHKACELGNTNACKMVVSRCIDFK
ncbi:MAG: tetratricopeptide repeat protein [Bacteroidales bacterium]|nr:tetratricopeptide repeat protein [Bacteroidales bacterium]